ncbi:MAG: lipopolysaccharide heptosyltransferase II [Leptospiraceae bacterium]|nr:lipopolysaccharide heptosyltransferase II [Leptospiraceae bacterium]MCP5512051.1 lipopolysaccharide heptosyltransferase II [Leptospiraceae bacterium]
MKILVIQTAFIGDLILSTGFFRSISEKYGTRDISVLVNSGTEDILKGNPYIKEVIPFPKKKIKNNIFKFFEFLRFLKSQNFSICISPHFSHRSSLISFFSGAVKRIGYKESGFSFLHTEKVSRPILGIHEINKLSNLIGVSTPKKPELYFISSEIHKIDLELKSIGKNYVAIAPSSVWETKRMPAEKFIELIRMILDKSTLLPLLIGSKSDQALCEEIQKDFGENIKNFSGKTNLQELSYIISGAKVLISNDSSPIHIASAFNIPTVQIYGATVPDFGYTTLSEMHFISEVNGLNCRPCGIHGGNTCPQNHFRCMKDQNLNEIIKFLLNFE